MSDCDQALKFYCDESGNTGTNWLDFDQPILVHGGWLLPLGSEATIAESVSEFRRGYRLTAPELKWSQLERPSRDGAFRELFEVCLSCGALPFFMVMDKQYAVAAKVVETFFDPLYNRHLLMGFTGDFETKKRLAEAVRLAPNLVRDFGPWLRSGSAPTGEQVRSFADDLADHLRKMGMPSFAGTISDFSEEAMNDLRGEFTAEPILRSTTWTVLWAMVAKLLDFVNERSLQVEIFQDQIVRFGPLIDMVRNLPGVARIELVDSKMHIGVQMADLLCGFLRVAFTKVTLGDALSAGERATLADLYMLMQEFEAWSGNLPESTWESFARIAGPELQRRYGGSHPKRARSS